MTLAEINRAIESKNRIRRQEAQQKASYDYILANLIGKSVSRIYSSSANMPDIYEAYPSIFNSEEIEEQRQEQQARLFAAQLKQFAQSHNKKLKEVGKNK